MMLGAGLRAARTPLQIREEIKSALRTFPALVRDKEPSHAAEQQRIIDAADILYNEATADLLRNGADDLFFENYLRFSVYMLFNKNGEGSRSPLSRLEKKYPEEFRRALGQLPPKERKFIRKEIRSFRESLVRGNG